MVNDERNQTMMGMSEDNISFKEIVIEHPTLKEIKAGLTKWQSMFPNRMKIETVGKSIKGKPIYLVKITNLTISHADKAVVLLTNTHVGSERITCTGYLHLIKWLISDDPSAAQIRKGIITLVMPCVNPDGYELPYNLHSIDNQRNSRGINIFNAWTWDGPSDVENNPEGLAIFKVAEKYHPDAAMDMHGISLKGTTMQESTAYSWGDIRVQGFCPNFAREIDGAAEKEGFLIMRPQEDTGRITVGKPIEGLEHHFFYVRDDITLPTFLYNRYHTLALNGEAGYNESIVIRLRKMLELGLKTWRNEFFPGYPNNTVAGFSTMSVSAWGNTAEERRRSRVELWNKANQLIYGTFIDIPAVNKMAAFCTTTVDAAKQWVGDSGNPADFLKRVRRHRNVNSEYLVNFFAGTVMNRKIRTCQADREGFCLASSGSNPIHNGIALRLFIPYNDAKIVDARVNGYPVEISPEDGYLIRQNPGTIVQFNIPPHKVIDLHLISVEYRTKTTRREGFTLNDWKLEE